VEAKDICEALKSRLPDAVIEFRTGTIDPFIVIRAECVREVLAVMRDDAALRFDLLQLVTGVDWPDRFEVVYHLMSLTHRHRVTLKAMLPREDPRVPSVATLYPTANWHERETYDLMGIVFEGHPDPRRIFLPDDWEGHPLRKDYVFPESYHGIPGNL